MEACCVRCGYQSTNPIKEQIDGDLGCNHGVQRAWRSGRCLHRSTEGSATLYHSHLGLDWVDPQPTCFSHGADTNARSHLIIITIIAAFTLYFFYANKKQRKGKTVLEETVRASLHSRTLCVENV